LLPSHRATFSLTLLRVDQSLCKNRCYNPVYSKNGEKKEGGDQKWTPPSKCYNEALDATNVRGLEALGPLRNLELDLVTLVQATETVALNRSVMDENVCTLLTRDETETLGVVEPLHSTFFHNAPSWESDPSRGGRPYSFVLPTFCLEISPVKRVDA
jgi:hypothetical protein